MKKGFTTGSCAAAAGKAAAYMLLGGKRIDKIEIETPAGIRYCPKLEEIDIGEDYVRCAVRKESGDDPDITNGSLIVVKVSHGREGQSLREIRIEGGEGVGRVTRPGLDQPVGAAAINSVPRQMIEQEVRQVMELFDHEGTLEVVVSVPGGRELAEKTFNPRLGIEGGISIIGTSGIVEPMSQKALLDSIRVELRQKKAMGNTVAVITPGNYGLAFMKEVYGFDLDQAVKCSNFIGDTIDMVVELGFQKLLLCGHIGKLVKLAGGIMNTHSREADCRMELMAAAAVRCGASEAAVREILDCVSTEEAVAVYEREGLTGRAFAYLTERGAFYLDRRGKGEIAIQYMMYSNQYGLLGKTGEAEAFLMEANSKDEE